MKNTLLLICLLLTSNISSQNRPAIDSLWAVYERMTNDSTRIATLIKLSREYYSFHTDSANIIASKAISMAQTYQQSYLEVDAINAQSYFNTHSKPDQTLQLAKQALSQSQQLNYQKGKADSYYNMGIYYYNRSEYTEALNYIERSLAIYLEFKDKKGVANAYNIMGWIYDDQEKYIQAVDYYKRALNIRLELNDKIGVGVSYNNIGLVYYEWEEYAKALDYYERALNIELELNNKRGIARVCNNMGLTCNEQGEYDKALVYYERAFNIELKLNNKRGMARGYNNMGLICRKQGKLAKALDHYENSLNIELELDNKRGMAITYNNMATVYKMYGEYIKALDYFKKSLNIDLESGYKKGIARSYNNIGLIYHRQGAYKKALDYHKRSLKIKSDLNNKRGMAASYHNIGRIYVQYGEYAKALDYYEKSLNIKIGLEDKNGIATSYNNIGIIYKEQGKHTEALDYFEKALNIKIGLKDKNGIAISYNSIGLMCNEQGEHAKALDYYEKALNIWLELNEKYEMIGSYNRIGEYYKKLGNYEKALENYQKSINLNSNTSYEYQISTYFLIGDLFKEQQNFNEAKHYYQAAYDSIKVANLRYFEGSVLYTLGEVYFLTGDTSAALQHYQQALASLNEIGILLEIPDCTYRLGQYYLQQQQYKKAKIHFSECLNAAEQISNKEFIAKAKLGLAYCALSKQEYDKALSYALRAKEYEVPLHQIEVAICLSKIYANLGQAAQSNQYINLAIALKDTLHNIEFEENLKKIQLKRELDLEIEKNKVQQQSIHNQQILTVAISLLGLVTAFFGYTFYTNNKKNKALASKEQNFRKTQNALFANLSHEFRTPLTILKIALDKMRKKDFSGSYQNISNNLYHNTDALAKLTNQMLDLAKISENKLQVRREVVEINAELHYSLSLLTSLVSYKGLKLRLVCPEKLICFALDKEVFHKIINNLVFNAIKFTPEGGEIIVGLTVQQLTCTIRVKDTGIGIPPEQQTHIFERYFRPTSEAKGNETGGLGLALTNQLVQLLDGSIAVESKPGEGSIFTLIFPHQLPNIKSTDYEQSITWPIEMESSKNVQRASQRPFLVNQLTAKVDTNLPLILIVEDNTELNEILYNELSTQYRTILAYDGKEALDLMESELPDLILTDIMMPRMNGIEFIKKITNDARYSHLPVIVISALESDLHDYELWEKGIIDFIHKPFDLELLHFKITNQLNNRKLFKEKLLSEAWGSVIEEALITSIDKAFLEKFLNYLHQHIADENLSVEKISRDLAMSRSLLYQKVKGLSGYSPTLFIRKFRMNKAHQLLKAKKGNVTEIAMAVGYYNLSHFSNVFKEEIGLPPSKV